MWRPPEKIRWEPQPGSWPNAETARQSKLFSPVAVGPVELEQRTWVPAMVPWRSNEEGFVTPGVHDWYGRFADGRPGAIVVEATGIRDIPSGPLLRIGDDRFIPGLTDLVQTVKDRSGGHTRLFIQLIDFLSIRRRPDPEKYFARFLEITDDHRQKLGGDLSDDAVRERLAAMEDEELDDILSERELESLRMGARERVTDTDLPHIANLPEVLPGLFADAAVRAKKAGFDGVELHYAHAYTMASFLSALNDRTDGYGGSVENRLRLPLEVYEAVRAAVGDDFAVGCRYLSDDIVEGGNTVEDACAIGAALAGAGMDFLSLSRGGKFEDAQQPSIGAAAYPYTGVSGYECMPQYYSDDKGPFGRNVEPVSAIRAAVRGAGLETPVVCTGGMHGFDQAESVLENEQGDIVGFARQALADPDWFAKVKSGRGEEAIVCEFTNYCEALDQKHVPVTCKLWDRVNMDEADILKTPDGKRRLTAPKWENPEY